jgi:hypothetical protein
VWRDTPPIFQKGNRLIKPGLQVHQGSYNPGGEWNETKGDTAPPDMTKTSRKRKFREFGLRPPPAVQRFCRDFGGTNPFGGPMYRLSWAPSQLTWMAGVWRINDNQGNFKFWHVDCGHAPKYPQFGERFILEVWKAPELFGSPFEWEQLNRQPEENGMVLGKLGPYPVNGGYEFCFHFQDTAGGFVLPTPTICELRIQEHRRISRKAADDREMQKQLAATARDAQEYERQQVRKEQSDILAEPFGGLNGLITPYVSMAGVEVPKAPAASSTEPQEVN